MLRIVHISDLHIRHSSLDNEKTSTLQKGVKAVLKSGGIEVHAGGHDDQKLAWLKTAVVSLRPTVIVATGDLTNFGDVESFKMATDFLADLRDASKARHLWCVPGNHDCLVERAGAIDSNGGLKKWLLKLIGKGNREVEVMREAARLHLMGATDQLPATPLLLENYANACRAKGFGTCHPAKPEQVDAGWGHVSFFAFNSVNGGGLMANKGAIGEAQFSTFKAFCDGQDWASHRDAIRIALLHHHPISAPQSLDGAANRAYDWMDDGPRLLNVLNAKEFHFVLHGHQHEPFTCAVDYGRRSQKQTLIVAAGSATQGPISQRQNSFNVIDLLNPFEARVQRYDLSINGFDPNSDAERVYPLQDLDGVRLSAPGGPLTDHDLALQSLIRNSFREFRSTGDHYRYTELSFDVVIDKAHRYCGTYRRKGVVIDDEGSVGPLFVITGSPAMKVEDMQLAGLDFASGDPKRLSAPAVLVNELKRKEIVVRPRQALQAGDAFDLALQFVWQASENERNDFDAISLMGLREPVGLLRYRVELPCQASQLKIESIGSVKGQLKGLRPVVEPLSDDRWRYTFEVKDPPPVAYVISFETI